jgi:hypothetical protein
MFLLGCMLYLLLITLIFYRFTFVNVTLQALTPPYWINMGSGGYYHASWSQTDHSRTCVERSQRVGAVSQRVHVILLVGRYVVDSIAIRSWILAPRLQEISSEI